MALKKIWSKKILVLKKFVQKNVGPKMNFWIKYSFGTKIEFGSKNVFYFILFYFILFYLI